MGYALKKASLTGIHFDSLPHNPDLNNNPVKTAFENIVGKGENAVNRHFFSFPPQCFLPFSKRISMFGYIYYVNAFNSKISLFRKET